MFLACTEIKELDLFSRLQFFFTPLKRRKRRFQASSGIGYPYKVPVFFINLYTIIQLGLFALILFIEQIDPTSGIYEKSLYISFLFISKQRSHVWARNRADCNNSEPYFTSHMLQHWSLSRNANPTRSHRIMNLKTQICFLILKYEFIFIYDWFIYDFWLNLETQIIFTYEFKFLYSFSIKVH